MSAKSNFLKIEKEEIDLLLENAKSGDSRSFESLSIHIKDISYSYFISKYYAGKMNNKDDAEDLTSSVYISFAEQYNGINNIEHWLRRVLFLTFVNWYKKERKHPVTELNESYHNIKSEEKGSDNFDKDRIVSLLGALSEEKQQIIRMRFWDEMKFNEISRKLKKSEAAVKKMFYRTIEELGKKIE